VSNKADIERFTIIHDSAAEIISLLRKPSGKQLIDVGVMADQLREAAEDCSDIRAVRIVRPLLESLQEAGKDTFCDDVKVSDLRGTAERVRSKAAEWIAELQALEPAAAPAVPPEAITPIITKKKVTRKANRKGGLKPVDGEKTLQAARDALAAMRKNPHLSLSGACAFQAKEHGLTISGRAVEKHARRIKRGK